MRSHYLIQVILRYLLEVRWRGDREATLLEELVQCCAVGVRCQERWRHQLAERDLTLAVQGAGAFL